MRRATTYILMLLAAAGCATGAAVQDKPAEPAMNVAWQKEIDIANAAHLAIGRRAVILAGAEAGLSAYALDDGRVLWRNDKVSIGQPVTTGGLVVIATPDALEALNEETGATAWQTRLPPGELPPTLHATDQLIGDGQDAGGQVGVATYLLISTGEQRAIDVGADLERRVRSSSECHGAQGRGGI